MSPRGLLLHERVVRFPRVSGDEPAAMYLSELASTFSPRERG